MYNEDRKRRFISDKKQQAVYHENFFYAIFKTTEKFENRNQKDVCNFTTQEIENMYKTQSYSSVNSLMMVNSLLVSYTNWCLSQGYSIDSQNHYSEFSGQRLNGLINKFILDAKMINREHVLSWCKQLPNPCDKFLLLGAFEGISGRDYIEFTELTENDIDIKASTINLYGRGTVSFSKQLCSFGIESANEYVYEPMNGRTEKAWKFLDDDNHVIKNFPNSGDNPTQFRRGRRIYSEFARTFKFLGIYEYTRIKDILNAGIVDYVNNNAKEKGISGEEYIRENKESIDERFGVNLPIARFVTAYGDYLV